MSAEPLATITHVSRHAQLIFAIFLLLFLGCRKAPEDVAYAGSPLPEHTSGTRACDAASVLETTPVPGTLVFEQTPIVSLHTLPAPPPVFRVTPAAEQQNNELFSFLLTADSKVDVPVATLTVAFGELCSVLETVSLTAAGSVVSDGDCHAFHDFTVDTVIPGRHSIAFSVLARPKHTIDAFLAFSRQAQLDPSVGISVTGVLLNASGTVYGVPSASAFIRTEIPTMEREAVEYNGEEDSPQFEAHFSFEDDRSLRIVRNSLFLIPIKLERSYAEEAADFYATIRLRRIEGPTSFLVNAFPDTDLPDAVLVLREANGDITLLVHLPEDPGSLFANLFLIAPSYRGPVRYELAAEGISLSDEYKLVGEYPVSTPTLLAVPPEEWETYE